MKKYRWALYLIFVFSLFWVGKPEDKGFRIFTIGDSTMASKKPEVYPETGWCQVLGQYFKDGVTVHNHAVNGRSSKSFIDEGRWNIVLDSLQAGDYVFIQFGHNDQKEYDSTRYTTPYGTYAQNLEKFVTESRKKGANPVLFTSIVRRKFDKNGKLTDTHGDYPDAVRKVAEKLEVPLIDLQELTEMYVDYLGERASKDLYLWTEPNEKFPEGRKDDTHLSVEGANTVARMVLTAMKRQELNLAKWITY